MGRTFQSKKFPSTTGASAQYRALVKKYPFALFGLPFMSVIIAGSFFLTPATALRYERHDKKIQRVSKEEALSLGGNKRKVDPKEEYYRLAAKDIDNWEQRRVQRLPGEPDGILE